MAGEVALGAQPFPLGGVSEVAQFHQNGGHLRAHEHIEGRGAHPVVRDPIVLFHPGDDPGVHQQGQILGLLHLGTEHQVGEDELKITDALGGHGVFPGRHPHRVLVAGQIQVIGFEAVYLAAPVGIAVDGDEQVGLLHVGHGRGRVQLKRPSAGGCGRAEHVHGFDDRPAAVRGRQRDRDLGPELPGRGCRHGTHGPQQSGNHAVEPDAAGIE